MIPWITNNKPINVEISNMKITIKISKLKNIYSFVANLSQWNELSCVKQRRKEWLARTGPLNNTEKKLLRLFAKILRETDFEIETLFLFEDDQKIWSSLNKYIGLEKTQQLKSILKAFNYRFYKIWKKDIVKINLIKSTIFKNKEAINKNIGAINKLCGLSKSPDITLYILLSGNTKEESQGRASGNTVALECSGWPITKIDYLSNNILLHELFHILFKKNKPLFDKLSKLTNQNVQILEKSKLNMWPPKIVIEEALISSFIPEGYLSEKNLKTDIIKEAKQELNKKNIDPLSQLRNFSAILMYDEAKKYVDGKKSLDAEFFNKIITVIKKFTKAKKDGSLSRL